MPPIRDEIQIPQQFLGITVSSTFNDLGIHRAALVKSIKAIGLTDISMENDSAKFIDVIDSSIEMVRKGAAYIGIIAFSYGQIEDDPVKNPDRLSITELEYNEAFRLERPILLFIMGDEHWIKPSDVETDPEKMEKLKSFRERAKIMREGSSVHRVYSTFNSLDDFTTKVTHSLAILKYHLDKLPVKTFLGLGKNKTRQKSASATLTNHIQLPFQAEPPYIVAHRFVGRQAQLEELNDWAKPANPHNVMLFEAIGGNGKSMLTWEWATKNAQAVRTDWAGIFWYSFYEKGAVMASFCYYALAYITQQPVDKLKKKKTHELKDMLLEHLKSRPWLMILDGLERVLMAYNRIDAAEVHDEEMDAPEDKISQRNPCNCINAEDDDLLRLLSTASPSKILITTRLVPHALINTSGQVIQGVMRVPLKGLRPTDAEVFFRACGIKGNSANIQTYLTTNCDCHPLTIGVLAGIIKNYLPSRGDFDLWIEDANGGGILNLANLNLVQKRNHILKVALDRLPTKSRDLLIILALLGEAADFSFLMALNPHVNEGLKYVSEPQRPETSLLWKNLSDAQKETKLKSYEMEFNRWIEFQENKQKLETVDYPDSTKLLENTVQDLEQRGLLQYDAVSNRYDLHAVVRGVTSGSLINNDINEYGQKVVDYYSAQSHDPYEYAETIEDVRIGINIVRTFLKMGNYDRAYETLIGDLSKALLFNLEAYKQMLALIKPFFPYGWDSLPKKLSSNSAANLANEAAIALKNSGELAASLNAFNAGIKLDLKNKDISNLIIKIRNISNNLFVQRRLAACVRIRNLTLSLAELEEDEEAIFVSNLLLFSTYSYMGQWQSAKKIWRELELKGRNWSREVYRPGMAEEAFATLKFFLGELHEDILTDAEKLSLGGLNRNTLRNLYKLRGIWQFEQGNFQASTDNLQIAVKKAREADFLDEDAETWLALAKARLGKINDLDKEIERLEQFRHPSFLPLAELWFVYDNREKAKQYALKAYKSAWADGEPFVFRHELKKATALITQLGMKIPELDPYDPAKDKKLPWEDDVVELRNYYLPKSEKDVFNKDQFDDEEDLPG